jgi:hypothetical protein
VLGGGVAVCPFCAVGSYAFLAGGSMVEGDVPDGLRGKGDRATLQGVNFEGLRRNGYSAEAVSLTQRACRELFRGGAGAGGAALAERAAAMLATGGCPAASTCPIYPTDGRLNQRPPICIKRQKSCLRQLVAPHWGGAGCAGVWSRPPARMRF